MCGCVWCSDGHESEEHVWLPLATVADVSITASDWSRRRKMVELMALGGGGGL